MEFRQRLQVELAQKLILTPSLQLAIKLLPMTTLELQEVLTQEMAENPLLDEVETEELQPTAGADFEQAEPAQASATSKDDT